MKRITKVESILLSAPYADPENMEVRWHLPSGYRTCGLVRLTLEDGLCGLGEGYLAVFAPAVFEEIVRILVPYIEGRDPEDRDAILRDLEVVTGYWSRQGAARHVLSAIDIALYDLAARRAGVPLYRYLNPSAQGVLKLYASGGDSPDMLSMTREMDRVAELEIGHFKIRARKEDVEKARLTMEEAAKRGIEIAIDMAQNLAVPGQTVEDVLSFRSQLPGSPFFLEEPLGPDRIDDYPRLRKKLDCRVAGGEIITVPEELLGNLRRGFYDIVQPDATVIGGIGALKEIFSRTGKDDTNVFVHCWGGPVGMAANYHAAAALGGSQGCGATEDSVTHRPWVEWPLPHYAVRDAMPGMPWDLRKGLLYLTDEPGLGMNLSEETIRQFPFRTDAVYNCMRNMSPGK